MRPISAAACPQAAEFEVPDEGAERLNDCTPPPPTMPVSLDPEGRFVSGTEIKPGRRALVGE
jgi:hypothetical protein